MKINFTSQHLERMKVLLLNFLFENRTINNKLGQPLDAVQLLHTVTINSLNNIKSSLAKQIENLENGDEWVITRSESAKLNMLKEHKELVNLIIGYKRHLLEQEEVQRRREELLKKISIMKEEAKTPEDRLKEAEAELASLESGSF